MPTTPNLLLPYPAATDPADVPTDMGSLANRIDTAFGVVSATPPASPFDGQLWAYVADAAAGVVWQFRYRAASASAFKWEFVGGPSIRSVVDVSESTASASYVDLATVQQLTFARAGEYEVRYGCSTTHTVSGSVMYMGLTKVGVVQVESSVLAPTGNYPETIARSRPLAPAAGDVIKAQYKTLSGATANFLARWLEANPIRVS